MAGAHTFLGMANVDEVWGWLYEPLQNLKAGRDEGWQAGRARLLTELGLSDPGEHPVTEALLYRLDELPEGERNGLLAGDELDSVAYQLVQEYTPAEAEVEGTSGYNERVWAEYLHTNLGQWDGTAESWAGFAEWFNYHAAEAGVAQPARTLIEYFTSVDNPQRISGFADYGVVITPPAEHAESSVDEEDWDEDEEEMPQFDEHGERLLAEILDEHPEFAEMSEAERRRLLAEVLSEESA